MSKKYYLWIRTYFCWTVTVNRERELRAGKKTAKAAVIGQTKCQEQTEPCRNLFSPLPSLPLYTTALGITMGMTGGCPNNI